jgi:hypothetical protein
VQMGRGASLARRSWAASQWAQRFVMGAACCSNAAAADRADWRGPRCDACAKALGIAYRSHCSRVPARQSHEAAVDVLKRTLSGGSLRSRWRHVQQQLNLQRGRGPRAYREVQAGNIEHRTKKED